MSHFMYVAPVERKSMQKSRPLTCSVQQMAITGVSGIWLISLVAALIFPDLQAGGFFLPRIHS